MKYLITFEIEAEAGSDEKVIQIAEGMSKAFRQPVAYVTVEEPSTRQRTLFSREYKDLTKGEQWRRLGEANYGLEVLTRKPE